MSRKCSSSENCSLSGWKAELGMRLAMKRFPREIAEEAVADLEWSSSWVKARGAEVVCETSAPALGSAAEPSKAAPAPESADSLIRDEICFSRNVRKKSRLDQLVLEKPSRTLVVNTRNGSHAEFDRN